MATDPPVLTAGKYMHTIDLGNHLVEDHGLLWKDMPHSKASRVVLHEDQHLQFIPMPHTHKDMVKKQTAGPAELTVEGIQQAVAGIWADAMDKYGEDWCAKSQVYIQQQLAGIGVKVDAPANGYISVAIHVSGMTSNDDLTDEDQDKVAAILEPLVKGLVFDLSNRTLTVAPYKGHLVYPDYPDVEYL